MRPFFGAGSFSQTKLKEQGSSPIFKGFLLEGGNVGRVFDRPVIEGR